MSNRSHGAGTGAHLQQVVAPSMELHRTIHVGFHGLQGMMPLTATHFLGEAMVAMTKYRERLHHLKLMYKYFDCAISVQHSYLH